VKRSEELGTNSKLDRIDINILTRLQADSNLTNVQLANAVGLSPSPCLQRVKRLEKAGLIQGYRAKINLYKLLEHVVVFIEVTLNDHRRNNLIKFEREI
jgi:DNA-binding Lrp family transcriptional regulator